MGADAGCLRPGDPTRAAAALSASLEDACFFGGSVALRGAEKVDARSSSRGIAAAEPPVSSDATDDAVSSDAWSAATAAAVSQWQEETRVREARRHAAVHVMPGVVPDFA